LIPLTADLAPPARRASAISIVLAGLLMGVLLARVLAGIIAQFSSYRNVYWMGVGGLYFQRGAARPILSFTDLFYLIRAIPTTICPVHLLS
jgi:MFS family permease